MQAALKSCLKIFFVDNWFI